MARGYQNAFDMSFAEIWFHMRINESIDAAEYAKAIQAGLLGSRGTSGSIRKEMTALGVKGDA